MVRAYVYRRLQRPITAVDRSLDEIGELRSRAEREIDVLKEKMRKVEDKMEKAADTEVIDRLETEYSTLEDKIDELEDLVSGLDEFNDEVEAVIFEGSSSKFLDDKQRLIDQLRRKRK